VAGNPDDVGGPGATDEVLPGDDDLEDQTQEGDDDDAEDADDSEGAAADGDADADADGDQGQAPTQGRNDLGSRARRQRAGRVERAEAENRQLRSQLTDFQRQLAELSAARNQPTAAEKAEADRREREALDQMTPAEAAIYTRNQLTAEFDRKLQNTQLQLWSSSDQQDYDRLLEANPTYRRFDAKVQEMHRQAPTVARRVLLATAIGLRALEGGGAARTRAANGATAQGQRQAARPAGGRSDVAPERGRGGRGGFEHLRDVQI
jgi:hypothetical protein